MYKHADRMDYRLTKEDLQAHKENQRKSYRQYKIAQLLGNGAKLKTKN